MKRSTIVIAVQSVIILALGWLVWVVAESGADDTGFYADDSIDRWRR